MSEPTKHGPEYFRRKAMGKRMSKDVAMAILRLAKRADDHLSPPDAELHRAKTLVKYYRSMKAADDNLRKLMATEWGTSLAELEALIRKYHERWIRSKNVSIELWGDQVSILNNEFNHTIKDNLRKHKMDQRRKKRK